MLSGVVATKSGVPAASLAVALVESTMLEVQAVPTVVTLPALQEKIVWPLVMPVADSVWPTTSPV